MRVGIKKSCELNDNIQDNLITGNIQKDIVKY